MKATSAPTCMSPASIRSAPIQTAATLEVLTTSITVGNMNAISRPVISDVSVRSSFAMPKRAVSSGSRTNARTTRMPVICSRRISFMRSIRTCITWNCGIIRAMTEPIASSSTGMATRRMSVERTVLADGHDHAADDRDRRRQQHRARHEHEDLRPGSRRW